MQYRRGLSTASSRPLTHTGIALITCAVAALILAGITRASAPNLAGPSHLIGQTASDFALAPEQNGKTQSGDTTLSDQRGKPLVLVFFYSLCTHCGPVVQAVEHVIQNHAETAVLYIDSPSEGAAITNDYAQRLSLNAPILLDTDGHVAASFEVAAYPATILLDANGTIRAAWIGEIDAATLRHALTALSPAST